VDFASHVEASSLSVRRSVRKAGAHEKSGLTQTQPEAVSAFRLRNNVAVMKSISDHLVCA